MISTIPEFPAIGDPNFNALAYAWAVHMGDTFVAEVNAQAAGYGVTVTATSTTSLTIGTGSKSLTIETGKSYTLGQVVTIAYTTTPSNYMLGTITSYNSGTGALVVEVSTVGGSGTYASWAVALSQNIDAASYATLTGTQTLTNKTLTAPVLVGVPIEDVYTITDGVAPDINPANGGIQLWTLGAARTPTASSFAAGQSVTLMIDDGTAYAITWSTIGVTWINSAGAAPTLKTSGYTPIVLWKVGSTVYGMG